MIVKEKIGLNEYQDRDFVKVAVDVKREVLAIDCLMHLDCAEKLLEDGSDWGDVWGAGWYPQKKKFDFFSLVNIRPRIGNRSMEIQLPEVRRKAEEIMRRLLL